MTSEQFIERIRQAVYDASIEGDGKGDITDFGGAENGTGLIIETQKDTMKEPGSPRKVRLGHEKGTSLILMLARRQYIVIRSLYLNISDVPFSCPEYQ